MARNWRRLVLLVSLVAVGLLLFVSYRYLEQFATHGRWYDRGREDMTAITHKCPPEVGKDWWEFAVTWTLNLHANCGPHPSWVEPGWRDGFAVELERRLQGPMTLADIEWIWDEYARHTTYGQGYSDKFRQEWTTYLRHVK